jgi:hypothetical protein
MRDWRVGKSKRIADGFHPRPEIGDESFEIFACHAGSFWKIGECSDGGADIQTSGRRWWKGKLILMRTFGVGLVRPIFNALKMRRNFDGLAEQEWVNFL